MTPRTRISSPFLFCGHLSHLPDAIEFIAPCLPLAQNLFLSSKLLRKTASFENFLNFCAPIFSIIFLINLIKNSAQRKINLIWLKDILDALTEEPMVDGGELINLLGVVALLLVVIHAACILRKLRERLRLLS